jgi:alpha-1,3-rhamnosyl/mannosyltransferase
MRVIVNGVSAIKPKTGVGHTTAYLHRALCEASPEDSFWLYPGSLLSRTGSALVRKLSGNKKSKGADGGSPKRSLRSSVMGVAKAAYREHFRLAARWGGFDLYHEPNFVPIRTHLPTVVTVHDLSVLLHPEWHPADRVAFHEKHFLAGLRLADHCIVVSQAVRREMIDVLGCTTHFVTAIHNGIGEQYVPQSAEQIAPVRSRLRLPDRYFLTVGTIEPRKNLLTVMQAFCDLPAEVRESCPLVLAGGWGWKSGPEREFFETQAGPKGVLHLGYVADADLPALYSGAAVLLYPSFYEGFGLPPAEMLACGGAVIASTATAVREIVGRHAPLVDPLDRVGWRDAMLRAVREPDWLDAFRAGGIRHARQFTWPRAAEQTLAVYRAVLGPDSSSQIPVRRAA